MSTENRPVVSVLMTAYNREKYIAEAIESVLASTYQNWELIIVDDCSADATVAIASSYAQQDKRIRVYVNEVNLGDYPNRNRAAGYATGKYLKYVDADDLMYPHGLEIIVNNMERFPEAGWGLMSFRPDKTKIYPFLLTPYQVYYRHFFESSVFHKAPLSAVIRKDVFELENGFKNVRHYGDMDMWQRLAMKHNLLLMQDGIVWWRAHPNQEAKKRSKNPEIAILTANVSIANVLNDSCPLTSIEKHKAVKKIRDQKINLIRGRFVRLKFFECYKMLRVFNQ